MDGRQGLARLLNLTDGLLGQGLSLLVAITTNEALSTLHPAVVRAGRCIAQIEVGNLSGSEAQAWLGRPLPERAEGYSLAELCALQDGTEPVRAIRSNTGCGAQVPRSICAAVPGGSTRTRFPASPPPVMCANACAPASAANARQSKA